MGIGNISHSPTSLLSAFTWSSPESLLSESLMHNERNKARECRGHCRLHAVPFFSLSNWETGDSEMRDRVRDWDEQGTRPTFLPILRAAVPLARSSLSIAVDEKRKGTACSLGPPEPHQRVEVKSTLRLRLTSSPGRPPVPSVGWSARRVLPTPRKPECARTQLAAQRQNRRHDSLKCQSSPRPST